MIYAERYPATEPVTCCNPACGETFTPGRTSWRKYLQSGRKRPMYCCPACSQAAQRGSKRKANAAPRREARLEPVRSLNLSNPPEGYGIPEVWQEVG